MVSVVVWNESLGGLAALSLANGFPATAMRGWSVMVLRGITRGRGMGTVAGVGTKSIASTADAGAGRAAVGGGAVG